MKKIFFAFALVAVYTYSSAQTKPAPPKPKAPSTQAKPAVKTPPKAVNAPLLKTSVDSASYAFGVSIANDIKSRGVGNLNSAVLAKAMTDVFGGGSTLLSPEKCQDLIMSFLGSVEKKKFEGNINEGTKFLSENAKKQGVVTLPSGLQYEVITQGTGVKPKATDEVTVNYKGTLLNGKQFDSSYDRGEPATFMLNQVIPGWTEGLQQMTAGSKYRFFIPYALAYGERAAGPDITPYSTLIFEVELISVQAK
ncbi:FKBP-type peptidyl-prolyl cis-trans isomerase [Daejeonella lutea]|uniref:Peptidyl-prolyl cis-trans isomerase n=1 Tax=Daejeonella lutea TaxID=572036 RepID=A0A1T5B3U1_9SPHI|nr:FKBP-type peptidyl-prolyl cis-trans isomerase [Daejeonella lutea]SKB41855.1 FKBP-type peptidyl-prolyl cis-trans isomerase FklB [Daejeonella lutea]